MHKEVKRYLDLKKKLLVLEYARIFGSNKKAYQALGIPKSTFYDWKKINKIYGEEGLKHKSLIARSHPRSLSREVVDKYLNSEGFITRAQKASIGLMKLKNKVHLFKPNLIEKLNHPHLPPKIRMI